jgi:hypothetical protein
MNKFSTVQFPSCQWMEISYLIFRCVMVGNQPWFFLCKTDSQWLIGFSYCEVPWLDIFDWKWQNRSIERDWEIKSQNSLSFAPTHLLFIALDQEPLCRVSDCLYIRDSPFVCQEFKYHHKWRHMGTHANTEIYYKA